MQRMPDDLIYLRRALALARRGYGDTSPNPMVGAVLVKNGRGIGVGWHHRAGEPHAEIEALRDARRRGHDPKGAVLYVTLEPCCTQGRTPPCTEAILAAGIKRVVVGATDPNPRHAGRAFELLKAAGVRVVFGLLAEECARLNTAFNHWIVHHTPLVTVKAAMTLDGKIATASGESKWITSSEARDFAMHLRRGSDAILAGINTVLADNPSLTWRDPTGKQDTRAHSLRRVILDPKARTPLKSRVVADGKPELTTVVVGEHAPKARVKALAAKVCVVTAPAMPREAGSVRNPFDLAWLMGLLGSENVTSLLVEGGGETNASFLFQGLAQRVAFFYAPKILGGRLSRRSVAGTGARTIGEILELTNLEWRSLGPDLLLTADVAGAK